MNVTLRGSQVETGKDFSLSVRVIETRTGVREGVVDLSIGTKSICCSSEEISDDGLWELGVRQLGLCCVHVAGGAGLPLFLERNPNIGVVTVPRPLWCRVLDFEIFVFRFMRLRLHAPDRRCAMTVLAPPGSNGGRRSFNAILDGTLLRGFGEELTKAEPRPQAAET